MPLVRLSPVRGGCAAGGGGGRERQCERLLRRLGRLRLRLVRLLV